MASEPTAVTPERSWPTLFAKLIAGTDLAHDDTAWAMDRLMLGEATSAQIAGLAVGLRAKGETAEEIAGMAAAMLAHAVRVHIDGAAVDIVGTGGDQAHTVNISTMAAVVTAAAGVPVVKHGARAATSQCGAADVLEALGVAISLSPDAVARCVTEVGIGFCFAPSYHPGYRHGAAPRRELGVPTAFNFLGPLTNPAQPRAGLVGCANPTMAPVLAGVFAGRGASVLVVRGDDGLDELTTTTTSTAWLAHGGAVTTHTIDPARYGIGPASAEQLRGGPADYNARVVTELIAGHPGPVRDAVLLNAAGAIAAFRLSESDSAESTVDAQSPVNEVIGDAVTDAAAAIDSGSAADLIAKWIALSSSLRE